MSRDKIKPVYEDKIWGKVGHCLLNDSFSVSMLKVEKGSWCSKHYHKDRVNMFWCLTAVIEIEEWEPNGDILVTLLEPGDIYTVDVGVPHRFRVIEDGEVLEAYYNKYGGKVSFDDIHRYDVGGRNG